MLRAFRDSLVLGFSMCYSFSCRDVSGMRVVECPGDSEAPTILFCHGYGASADHLTFFPDTCRFEGFRPTWIFPDGIEKLSYGLGGCAWFPLDLPLFQSLVDNPEVTKDSRARYQKLLNVDFERPRSALENLIEDLNLDRKSLIIGGFSQGAMITTHLILNTITPFMGALICSGAMIFDKGWETQIHSCPKTPYLQSHGYHDGIIAYCLGEELHWLLTGGLQGELISFQGKHEIPSAVIKKIQKQVSVWAVR